MHNAPVTMKKALPNKRDIPLPYPEISVFASMMAITLSCFFSADRTGLVNPMTGAVVKTAGMSLFLLNFPPLVFALLKNKSPHERMPWYRSLAFFTIAALSAIILAGFILQDNTYYLDSALSLIGCLAFLFVFSRFIQGVILRGTIVKNLLFIAAFIAFSLWVTGVIWGSGNRWGAHFYIYLNPLYIETIYSGNAHLDTLFHSSISHMIQTYGIPSTGLDGLPYIPYHFGSHWIFAQISKFMQINPIYFYQLCYPVIFLPFYFYSFLLFVAVLRNFRKTPGEPDQPFFGLLTFTIFAAAFISFLPNRFLHSLGLGGHNNLISQSYLISLTLLFLFFSLIISFWKYSEDNKKVGTTDLLFLFIMVPSFIAGIGLAKISVMFILFIAGTYLFIRLGLFRHYQFLVSCIISTIVFFTVFSYTKPTSFAEVYSIKAYLHNLKNYLTNPWNSLYFIVHYFWSLVFLGVSISALSKSTLKDAFLNKTTVLIEMVLVICIAGFLPGALMRHLGGNEIYFSDVQRWVSLSLLLALLNGRGIQWKLPRTVLLLFLLPAIYIVCSNGKEIFSLYRSQTGSMKKQITGIPSKEYEMLNLLLSLDRLPLSQKRNSLLFIPQNNSAYWGLAERINCYSVPFFAPALSGIALLDGLPPANCGEPDDWILRHNGYDCYRLRTQEQTEEERTRGRLCSKALEKGFKNIMRIDQTGEGLRLTEMTCE